MMQPVTEVSFDSLELLSGKTLFVFALPSEAAEEFEHVNKVFVGIGKVNAAYELTKAIRRHKPQLIINLGSAGSNFFKKGEVICCTKFIQRDMDVRGLGFKLYETPFSNINPMLSYGIKIKAFPEGICGSGDSFEMNHSVSDYNVIDMEAYPLAYVAMMENIPFLCLKYISDGADGTAADDWAVQVHNAATAFKKILFPPE
jgi:adenosylhomocysteine nucleosidase